MKFNILFLKTNGGFAKKEKQRIRSTIKSVTNHAAKILDLRRGHLINFTVYPFDKNYIGGLAQAEDFIQISIPQRKKFNEEELKSIIYHEIHHIKKGYFGYAKKRVFLLEALLLEGLATVFALEQVPKYIPKWSRYGKNLIKE